MRAWAVAVAIFLMLAHGALAVQPDEVLPDPAMEARARQISQVLRCPVCQGETIDESNAPISRDLRLFVRERLVAGDDDDQVVAAVVDRFGEFVLFQPPISGGNLILWLAGPMMLLLGLLIGWRFLRRREQADAIPDLTSEERARLNRIMRD